LLFTFLKVQKGFKNEGKKFLIITSHVWVYIRFWMW
jgi:hypothetical protein